MKLCHGMLSRAGLLLALCLAGCAAPPPKPPPPPPKPPVTPATVDGLYRGTSTRYQADNRRCPSPGLVTLHVLDGQFTYHWSYRHLVPATILPDGSVHGQLDDVTLTGQVVVPSSQGTTATTGPEAALRIQGDVFTASCGVHYTVVKHG